MYIATQPGDLPETASMSEEAVRPSEHEHVGTFTPPQNQPEGIKEVKKSAFQITHVATDNENEDLEASQLHNKTISEDDNILSPLSSDMLIASTPSKNPLSASRDIVHSSSTFTTVGSATTITNFNGGLTHLHGSRFRKVNDYVRERWKVSDSLEMGADEHSDLPEPRGVQKMMEITSNSSSPSTPRRNASTDIASSSNLSDAKSDTQLDEGGKSEGTTLTETHSTVTSQRPSTEYSQDDTVSNDDNCENYSQGTPSEININVKIDADPSNAEISSALNSTEAIKSEALKIQSFITNMETIISQNTKLKQTIESLRKQNEKLQAENQQLRKAQQTSSSTVQS